MQICFEKHMALHTKNFLACKYNDLLPVSLLRVFKLKKGIIFLVDYGDRKYQLRWNMIPP